MTLLAIREARERERVAWNLLPLSGISHGPQQVLRQRFDAHAFCV
jgi:hypothetical protein